MTVAGFGSLWPIRPRASVSFCPLPETIVSYLPCGTIRNAALSSVGKGEGHWGLLGDEDTSMLRGHGRGLPSLCHILLVRSKSQFRPHSRGRDPTRDDPSGGIMGPSQSARHTWAVGKMVPRANTPVSPALTLPCAFTGQGIPSNISPMRPQRRAIQLWKHHCLLSNTWTQNLAPNASFGG